MRYAILRRLVSNRLASNSQLPLSSSPHVGTRQASAARSFSLQKIGRVLDGGRLIAGRRIWPTGKSARMQAASLASKR